jgi:hypothetical protein
MDPWLEGFVVVTGALTVATVVIILTGALASRLVRGRRKDVQIHNTVADVANRLEEIDARLNTLGMETEDRLADVEGRIDFAERILQRQRDNPALPPH